MKFRNFARKNIRNKRFCFDNLEKIKEKIPKMGGIAQNSEKSKLGKCWQIEQ